MDFLAEVTTWFSDPANWQGVAGIPNRVLEHVWMSFLSVGLATAVALPTGLAIGHTRRAEFVVTSIANIGRAVPSFAVLALALPLTIRAGLGLGFWPTVIALFLLAIPPILTNTHVGIVEVDPDVIESSRGMGMSGAKILTEVELPLAAPLIVAGLRTAVVQVIATATLAALVGWGGLGRFLIDGFAVNRDEQVFAGALLVAAVAVAAEILFALIQRILKPRSGTQTPLSEPARPQVAVT